MSVVRSSAFAFTALIASLGGGCSASTSPAGSGGNGATLPGTGGVGAGGSLSQGGSTATASGGSNASGASASGGVTSGGNTGTPQAGTGASSGGSPTGGSTSQGGNAASTSGGSGGGSAQGGAGQGGAGPQGGTTAGGSAGGSAQGGAGGQGGAAGGGGGASNSVCPPGPYAASPLSGNTMASLAGSAPSDAFNQNGNSFTTLEGAVWIGDSLYFSEIQSNRQPPRSRILKLDSAGKVTQFYPKDASDASATSGTNGLALDPTGKLIGANHQTGAITEFDLASGTPTDLVSGYMGSRFNSPNDLVFRADGTLYFSDPNAWQAPAQKPQSSTRVYRVAKGSTTATAVLDPSKQPSPQQPNGVTFSLDQSTLFVSGPEGVFSYPVQADGSLGTGTRLSSPSRGDGMTLDCAGNLYVTSDASVYVLDPAGKQIGMISVPSSQASAVTNVAFGGSDRKTLYITAQGGSNQHNVLKATLAIPGLPY